MAFLLPMLEGVGSGLLGGALGGAVGGGVGSVENGAMNALENGRRNLSTGHLRLRSSKSGAKAEVNRLFR